MWNTAVLIIHFCDLQYLQSRDLVLEDLLRLVEVGQHDLCFSVMNYT